MNSPQTPVMVPHTHFKMVAATRNKKAQNAPQKEARRPGIPAQAFWDQLRHDENGSDSPIAIPQIAV